MNDFNRRKNAAVKTQSHISYLALDRNGRVVSQGMGAALQISRGGLLFETLFPIETPSVKLMIVDSDHRLVQIEAKITHRRKSDSTRFHFEIRFLGTETEKEQFAGKLVQAWHYRKSSDFSLNPQHCEWPTDKSRP